MRGKKSALRKKGEEKEKKKKTGMSKKKAQKKVVEINPDVLVNIISVNGPNALGKRQRLSLKKLIYYEKFQVYRKVERIL